MYEKYLELKSKNQKLSDRNLDLESRVDRLREEVSVVIRQIKRCLFRQIKTGLLWCLIMV